MGNKWGVRREWVWVFVTAACVANSGVCVALGAQTMASTAQENSERRAPADPRVAEIAARRVDVTLRSVPIADALEIIAGQAKIELVFARALLDTTIRVSMRETLPVSEAFRRVLLGTGLSVDIRGTGRAVLVRGTLGARTMAVGRITGIVVDSASGAGVSGAAVTVVGRKISTTTQPSGKFALEGVPVGEQQIRVRLLGYRATTRTVSVTEDAPVAVRVLLPQSPNVLSGVVTTAAGAQDRRTIGNDITIIDADSVLRIAPVTSVTDLLATRVPGLTVQHSSGVPGAPARLRLRGIGGGLIAGAANTSNDPILIVDGVRVYSRQSTARDANLTASKYAAPSAIDQIDVNSIDKIEVFKGPSATSQWGSDAGNGVIVITTKQGRAGKTEVSASASYGRQKMPGTYTEPGYYIFGRSYGVPEDESQLYQLPVCVVGAASCVPILDSVVQFQALNSERLSTFGTGSDNGVSATVRGGSAALTYALTGTGSTTLGYLRMPLIAQDVYALQYGDRPPTWMRRPNQYETWGYSATFGAMPATGLRISLVTSLFMSDQRQSSTQTTLSSLSSTYLDTITALKAVGTQPEGRSFVFPYVRRVTDHSRTSTTALQGDWTAWSAFPIQATMGISTVDRTDKTFEPWLYVSPNGGETYDGYYSLGRGAAETRTGTANATLFPRAPIVTRAGLQVTRAMTEDVVGTADSLHPGVSAPTAFNTSFQNSYASTTAGWFLEPQLRGADRFFVTPGFRLDGGSASTTKGSTTGRVLSLFPKLNLSWVAVDRESQGRSPLGGILSLLRPRIAFGIAGVQPDPTWNLRLLGKPLPPSCSASDDPSPECALANGADGLVIRTLGNSRLHPERSREVEGGFDADLWGTRVTLTASAYYKLRIDAIEPTAVAPSIAGGTLLQYTNIGNVRNTGTELSLTAGVIETPSLRWGITASYSANRNVLLDQPDGVRASSLEVAGNGGGVRFVSGYPIDGRWEVPILGYNDSDGDGRLTNADVRLGDSAVYIGNGQPKFSLPFSTNISMWGGVVILDVGFDYKHDVTQLNRAGLRLLVNSLNGEHTPLAQQAAALAVMRCGGIDDLSTGQCNNGGSVYGGVQNVNILRMNTLSARYQVPSTISRRLGLPYVGIALQGSNLGLWTNYRGKDPDVNSNTIGENLEDSGQLPLPREWRLRIDLRN